MSYRETAYSYGLIPLQPGLDTETVPDNDFSKGDSVDDDRECITMGDGGGSHGSTRSVSSSFNNPLLNSPRLPLPIVLQSFPNILSLI